MYEGMVYCPGSKDETRGIKYQNTPLTSLGINQNFKNSME
jgi:hypothetical protein